MQSTSPRVRFSSVSERMARAEFNNLVAQALEGESVVFYEKDETQPILGLCSLRLQGGHSIAVNSVCFSPNGALLASASQDHSICIWNVSSGKRAATLTGHSSSVNSVCFSPDGVLLASGSSDTNIRIWVVSMSMHFSFEWVYTKCQFSEFFSRWSFCGWFNLGQFNLDLALV